MIIDTELSEDVPRNAVIQSVQPKLSRLDHQPYRQQIETSPSPEKTDTQSPDLILVSEQPQPASAFDLYRITTESPRSDIISS